MVNTTTSNINKKFNDLLEKELSSFFDMLLNIAESEENFDFSKEKLQMLANEYFMFSETSKKGGKKPKAQKEIEPEERCKETKKDGSQCNGSKTKKEEYKNTEYSEMCSLHINAAKKAKETPIEDKKEHVVQEIEKPIEKKKKQAKKEIIKQDELP